MLDTQDYGLGEVFFLYLEIPKVKESKIRAFIVFAMLLSVSQATIAADSKETLACMAGAAADIDGSKSYSSDASGIRFLLTLNSENGSITSIDVKHTGVMQGMPVMSFKCMQNGDVYSCSNAANVMWYYPDKMHGIRASLGIHSIFEEKRANTGGIYNYSCISF
ncbi:hypothetical protein L1D61_10340 [Vibrio mediterranei]|nr:hypothetical protein [Vibrio mediterranei]